MMVVMVLSYCACVHVNSTGMKWSNFDYLKNLSFVVVIVVVVILHLFIWFFLFFYYNLLYALQHHMKNIYKVICFKLKYFLFHIFFFFFDLFWFVLSLKVFNFLVNMFFGCGVYFNSIRFSHCDLIFVFFFVYYAFDHKFLTRKQMQLRFFHQPLMNCFNLKILGFLFCGLEIFNLIWFLFKLKKKHLGGEIYDFFVLLNYTL